MTLDSLFKKPKNELEKAGRQPTVKGAPTNYELSEKCPSCGTETPLSQLWDNLQVCQCGYCFRMSSRQRIRFLTDPDSFKELWGEMESVDITQFPRLQRKSLKALKRPHVKKKPSYAAQATIGGMECAMFIMEPYFMMGSMGTVVGEKITRLFEYATEKRLPVIGCTVSGGARMQEGILSLMQMAKTSGAVMRPQRQRSFIHRRINGPHNGRRDGELCHGRRYHPRRTGRHRRLCRRASCRADGSQKGAGGLPEGRDTAGARFYRQDRSANRAKKRLITSLLNMHKGQVNE